MARITADTNLLLRAAVGDDAGAAAIAAKVLEEAEFVAVPAPVLCEFVWVLDRAYRRSREEIASAIRELLNSEKALIDRPATEAGLAILEAGGDFADGLIAYEGRKLGGSVFVTFDRDAATLLERAGEPVRFLHSR